MFSQDKNPNVGIMDRIYQEYGPKFNQAIDSSVFAVQNVRQQWETRNIGMDAKSSLLDSEIEPKKNDASDNYKVNTHTKYEFEKGGYEAKLVAEVTPMGGINGLPDKDAMQSFLAMAISLNCNDVIHALHDRLLQPSWQTISRALCITQELLKIRVGENYRNTILSNKSFLDTLYELLTHKRLLVQEMTKQTIQALGLHTFTSDQRNILNQTAKHVSTRDPILVDRSVGSSASKSKEYHIDSYARPRNVTPSFPSPIVRKAAEASARRRSAEDREAAEQLGYPNVALHTVQSNMSSYDQLEFSPSSVANGQTGVVNDNGFWRRTDSGGFTAFDFLGNSGSSTPKQSNPQSQTTNAVQPNYFSSNV